MLAVFAGGVRPSGGKATLYTTLSPRMAVARPEPSKTEPSEDEPVESAVPSTEATGGVDSTADSSVDSASVDSSSEDEDEDAPASDDLDDRPPPTTTKVPPPSSTLNTRISDASNAKQARIREAEEDRALIARAQQGDMAAFRRLVERHQRRAFAIALALVRDENDARELVQDAFLRVYKGLGSFQGGSSFFTWLYRIVTNLAIDLMRKPGRRDAELVDGQAIDEDA